MRELSWRPFVLLWLLASTATLGLPPLSAQVPTLADVAGHDFGERITVHHQMEAYVRALAAASPRVTVVDQGRSWEGRQLVLAIITSEANHARLADIRDVAQQLADPRRLGDGVDVDALIARQPAIVWMGGSIHGFELSGSEGLLKLVQDLTTRDDEATRAVLDNVVLLVDPMINPDGRDAFAAANHRRMGRAPNPSNDDWNNDWSGWQALDFRTGHYFFDTNRDWFAHTQAETRARWPTIRDWRPQVIVDAHEMGSDVEFYFDPPAEPFPPVFPRYARDGFARFNDAYVAAFDAAGYEYMTGERFNYFYPGYTTSWGSYQGAIGMLYEQGSTRGLAITRPDDTVRTLRDALDQQHTAAWAAVTHSAAHRETLLRDYLVAHRQAIAAVSEGPRRYLVPPADGADPGARAELLALLGRNGIEVGYTTEEITLDGLVDHAGRAAERRTFPAGTAVIEVAQPRRALVQVLMAPDQPLPEDFLAEARARVLRGENPRFYDMTAWSVPLLFDVPVFAAQDARAPTVGAQPAVAVRHLAEAGYAYLLDGDDARTPAMLHALSRRGVRAAVALTATQVAGQAVARGSGVVRVGQNGDDLHAILQEEAARYGVHVRAVDTGLGDEGAPALGSAEVAPFRARGIALLAEGPVFAYSFGWAWWVLEEQFQLPVTVLRVGSLANTDLSPYGSLVVPNLMDVGALERRLGEPGMARLRQWLRDGGTLVTLASATDFARAALDLDLRAFGEDDASSDDDEEIQRFTVPGAFLQADLDPHAWLSAGRPATLPFLVFSNRIYQAPGGAPNPGRRVVARVAAESPLLAGHAWPESLERLPGAVLVFEQRMGAGRIVAFAEDVNFRGYWRGADRLFLNAVVLGPSGP